VRREYDASAGEAEAAPNGLGRVVAGMVSNALDACAEHARALAGGDGAPAYEPAVTVRTRRSGDTVTVEVEDNGCGMAETVRARAFEPFFTTKPAGSGHTGLGLSLAHEVVVEGHGGTLEVTSVEGEGTTLTISLPALPPVHA
jgi:signal transduction histidine kinase